MSCDICPECGAKLLECVAIDYAREKMVDGVKCPMGCNLWGYWGT